MTVPEQDTTTELVRGIWSRVLRVDDIGEADNFFGLGGTSINAMVMLSMVEAETGAQVGLAAFFGDPTLGGLVDDVLASD